MVSCHNVFVLWLREVKIFPPCRGSYVKSALFSGPNLLSGKELLHYL
jgi:hypothetical protein